MIKEEAIRFLNEYKEFLLKGCFWEETRMNINEAFDIAIEAIKSTQHNASNTLNALDCISRQAAIDDIETVNSSMPLSVNWVKNWIKTLPSAQPERDIPMKPNETIDSSWGIRKKQAVCPKCDYYLGYVEFIGNPNGKKITYCETCGQAINWEGWEWEE